MIRIIGSIIIIAIGNYWFLLMIIYGIYKGELLVFYGIF